jgi:ribosomal protein S18 acetylase RimI-like enzyme
MQPSEWKDEKKRPPLLQTPVCGGLRWGKMLSCPASSLQVAPEGVHGSVGLSGWSRIGLERRGSVWGGQDGPGGWLFVLSPGRWYTLWVCGREPCRKPARIDAVARGRHSPVIVIRQMRSIEMGRIAEIDRSEHVTLGYFFRDGKLEAEEVDWQVPRWFTDGRPEHSVQEKVEAWKPYVERDGLMFGAFDRHLLVGMAILRPKLTEEMAQLVVLHVSRDYRRQGIATRLSELVYRLALEMGAKEIYVSATPSESAVGFYRRQGFRLAEKVDKELYALEPEDIHMIKVL